MVYCAHQASLLKPDQKGTALRAHLDVRLKRIRRQHGSNSPEYRTAAAELRGPKLPAPLAYLWPRFVTLNGMRAPAMSGIAPFTPEMLRAANELFAWRLTPREVDVLCELDATFRKESN
jgi:hypothetical protein